MNHCLQLSAKCYKHKLCFLQDIAVQQMAVVTPVFNSPIQERK